MTVQPNAPISGPYLGNGVTVRFPRTFAIYETADLVVSVDGQEITTGFTVLTPQAPTGEVVFDDAPANKVEIFFTRRTSIDQETQYSAQGAVSPKQVERDLDKTTLIAQELSRDLERSVKAPIGVSAPTITAQLAEGHFFTADADGNLVDGGSAGDIINAQANAAVAQQKAEAAAASATAALGSQEAASTSAGAAARSQAAALQSETAAAQSAEEARTGFDPAALPVFSRVAPDQDFVVGYDVDETRAATISMSRLVLDVLKSHANIAAEMVCSMGIIVESEKAAMPGFAKLDGVTLSNGALSYGRTAAAYPEYVSGNDLVLSPHHGRVTRMADPSGTVNPEGASQSLGDLEEDQNKAHAHNSADPANPSGISSFIFGKGFTQSQTGASLEIDSSGSASEGNEIHALTSASGGIETRVKSIIVNRFIPLVA